MYKYIQSDNSYVVVEIKYTVLVITFICEM